jgi:hypothetical protein
MYKTSTTIHPVVVVTLQDCLLQRLVHHQCGDGVTYMSQFVQDMLCFVCLFVGEESVRPTTRIQDSTGTFIMICLAENTTIAAAPYTYYVGWQLRTPSALSTALGEEVCFFHLLRNYLQVQAL